MRTHVLDLQSMRLWTTEFATVRGHTIWVCEQVVDEGRGRAVVIEKEGFPDAVVWNPWIDKAAGMGDFGDEEYKVNPHAASVLFVHPGVARALDIYGC